MTLERAQKIVNDWHKVEEIDNYLKIAAKEDSPHRRLAVLMGNLGYWVPAPLVQQTYETFRDAICRQVTDPIKAELKAIPE